MPWGIRLFLVRVSYACLLCVCFVGMYMHAHNVYMKGPENTGKKMQNFEKMLFPFGNNPLH